MEARVTATDEQLSRVWDFADKLKPGQIIAIKDKAPNNPELFIECLKSWIVINKYGEFNQHYTKFKRLQEVI